MRRRLIFAALLTLCVPAAAETAKTAIPADKIAEAKFSADDPALVDAIAEINREVNKSITYEDDKTHYGIDELWVMFPPDSKGDCEDYALTKLGVLSADGFPIVTNAKIVTVIVKGVAGHAILAVLLPSGAVAYLDSAVEHNAEPMTRGELEADGYQFFDWKA